MKKKNLKNLTLNKKFISNLRLTTVQGGRVVESNMTSCANTSCQGNDCDNYPTDESCVSHAPECNKQ